MKRLGLGATLTAWGLLLAPVASTAPAGAQAPAGPPAGGTAAPAVAGAPLLEPYRFNARERTARALAEWEKGSPEEAVAPLDSALRLQPGDPLVEYNAGTAHLGAKQPDAARMLEQAAKHAPPGLAADAYYNLGNARLEAKDAQGAIEAYKSSLRAQADLSGAKRNLELALRLLDEQQKQQEQQKEEEQQKQEEQQQKDSEKDQEQQGESNPKPQPGDSQDRQGSPKPSEPSQPSEPSEKSQPDRPQPGEGQPQPGQPQRSPDRPLPQFQDQKDMTAEQAAAILQAVENLERQQRRDQARALARAKTSVEKDW